MCEHEEFEAAVTFNRVAGHPADADGLTLAVYIDVRGRCAACRAPLTWLVPDSGVRPDHATVSTDRHELRVPAVLDNL